MQLSYSWFMVLREDTFDRYFRDLISSYFSCNLTEMLDFYFSTLLSFSLSSLTLLSRSYSSIFIQISCFFVLSSKISGTLIFDETLDLWLSFTAGFIMLSVSDFNQNIFYFFPNFLSAGFSAPPIASLKLTIFLFGNYFREEWKEHSRGIKSGSSIIQSSSIPSSTGISIYKLGISCDDFFLNGVSSFICEFSAISLGILLIFVILDPSSL